jgi:hypothetical protein
MNKVSFEWNSATTPEEGAIVYALASDDIGPYLIPFPVVFRDDSWWNARTREVLDTFIVGWRRTDDVQLSRHSPDMGGSEPNDPWFPWQGRGPYT